MEIVKMDNVKKSEMDDYVVECEAMFEYTIGEIARIGDEYNAMEYELAAELCRRIKEHFKLK